MRGCLRQLPAFVCDSMSSASVGLREEGEEEEMVYQSLSVQKRIYQSPLALFSTACMLDCECSHAYTAYTMYIHMYTCMLAWVCCVVFLLYLSNMIVIYE